MLPYLKYLWNVSYAVFTPFYIMLIMSKYRFQLELDMINVLLYNGNSWVRSHLVTFPYFKYLWNVSYAVSHLHIR